MKEHSLGCEQPEDLKYVLNNPLRVVEGPTGKIIDFYLVNTIQNIQEYLDFLREVSNAKQDDTIVVHINNYGGSLDVAMNIYDALQLSRADVKICVEGMCASAASMVMLAGNEWEVFPHACVMIHAWSGAEIGKWNEIQASFDYSKRVTEEQFRSLYKNFLTDEETEDCLKGKDFYFDCKEIMARLTKYQEDDAKKHEAIQAVATKYQDIMNQEIEAIINDDNKPKKQPVKKSTAKKKTKTGK